MSFEKLKVIEKLRAAKSTSFGDAIRVALDSDNLEGALTMIKEQRELGNEGEVEWCVGASTLAMIDKLES